MADFTRNNLDKATSPYLQQHKGNPIHWQEWSAEAVEYARKEGRLLFVSVGYSTCHWCHVMAGEAFEDKEVADYLNRHFVPIKVDREQRPDIDHYLMAFCVETTGSGGWPLNVIMAPDIRPVTAMTYVPVEPKYGMAGLIDILQAARDYYEERKDKIREYHPPAENQTNFTKEQVIKEIKSGFDDENGGFGHGMKFPPHNTLLFLLQYYEKHKNEEIRHVLEKTLDVIMMRGLHDHLQGGFYRYCTDSSWTIPHFEKMLYDQAMLLWVYSWASKVLGKYEYRIVAEMIIKCLEETFEGDGLFYSAHDADTNHEEGGTYLWTKTELENALSTGEFRRLAELYDITDKGNLEGKNHLIKKEGLRLDDIENKLLKIRKAREQPFIDKKVITSWNALAGIGLLMAHRHAGTAGAKEKSELLFKKLMEKHYIDGKLYHSSLDNNIQKNEFLEDYASMLLFASLLHEETGDKKGVMEELYKKTMEFKKEHWVENKVGDFIETPAQQMDHPAPSSVSLADFAVFRAASILGNEAEKPGYGKPLERDFASLAALISRNMA
ncbi:MAG: thioredoxin domain-containing protein [Candidatus Aenigmarchaeota archaeon]|nr:thioredoxin domain-containing protein [Candidatus Aenigmarchaeota archaeon]